MDATYDKMFYGKGELLGGIDEAGVSDIAGPLVAACVVLPRIDLHKDDLRIFEVNDSKQIPEKYRKQHAEVVWQVATAIGIGEVSPAEFDYMDKHAAIRLAMLRAVAACRSTTTKKPVTPNFLLIDGKMPITSTIKQKDVVDADTKSLCVAAASIVAKVYRDEIMIQLHEKFPWYDWVNNKGYPCENQFVGIDEVGVQVGIHRLRSWPFVPHPKYPENAARWSERRYRWRRTTEKRFGKELGEVWNTRPRF